MPGNKMPEVYRDIYKEIIYRLAKKYKISHLEVERIADSQFKLLLGIINEKGSKVVSIKHLGKFMPTVDRRKRLKYYAERDKKNKLAKEVEANT